MNPRVFMAGAVLLLAACSGLQPRTSLPVEVWPSPNYGERRPNFVIIHHTTDDNANDSLKTLSDPIREVSSHYLIGRDGRIYYLVDEGKRAWHAGESYWGGNRDLNSSSIGIELDNTGDEPFAEPQIAVLLELLADLKARWKIPQANILGHGDIVPGRKVDPSAHFPWQRLAAAGFGLWCDPPYEPVPEAIDDLTLLALFGYEVTVPRAAVAAFQRHFSTEDETGMLSPEQRGMLQCLIRKRQAGG